MSKSVFLVLTSAIAIEGEIARAGSIVEVGELEAKNFLHRGKARLATEADGIVLEAEDDEADLADLSKMNKTQLSELAASLEIETGELTKAQLIEAINSKREAE